ncbi:hypothetical protein CYMTET_20430 [Cymbomonas tetramitiformis]|uniref:Myb-like domain-containing protein n=1 Tax=Cymbomonas tetramitiformis TaxID=36881 RepID=A0AAE0G406_9CHLO|nr:hypothetical protein CYMTET_20430 [Cymbomonas tetramitiformis]
MFSPPATLKIAKATANDDPEKEKEDAWSSFAKSHQKAGQKRKVVEWVEAADAPPQLTEYEKQRLENIEKNKKMLQALGVNNTIQNIQTACSVAKVPDEVLMQKSRSKPRASKADFSKVAEHSRRSKRLRGGEVEKGEGIENHELGVVQAGEESENTLLTLDEYFAQKGVEPGPWVDGHFNGWVEDGVRVRCGIAASKSAAWDQNGGGQFSRKLPAGVTAKDMARKMLHKNPNQYFYRLTEPNEEQWMGNWTQEEIAHFVAVGKKYGAGDKWGLFSTHIPHRVGYQCSAAYRHFVIPYGLLRDPNFKMTHSGEAIWAPVAKAPKTDTDRSAELTA